MSAATATLNESRFAERERSATEDRKKDEKKRINIFLSQRSLDLLKRLEDKTDASSPAEVFKNALRLYLAFVEETEKGNEIFVRDQQGHERSYKVFY